MDERKIFYVGLTRAETAVVFTRPKKIPWGKNYQRRQPSQFLNELGLKPTNQKLLIQDFRDNYPIHRSKDDSTNNTSISFSKIHTYLECPRKYSLRYELKFATKLLGQMSFGLTLHQCVDIIHKRYLLDGNKHFKTKELQTIIDNNWIEITYRNTGVIIAVWKTGYLQ